MDFTPVGFAARYGGCKENRYHAGVLTLSFLSEDAQQWVLVAIQETNAVITTQQSAMLKESDKKGELTFPMVRHDVGKREKP